MFPQELAAVVEAIVERWELQGRGTIAVVQARDPERTRSALEAALPTGSRVVGVDRTRAGDALLHEVNTSRDLLIRTVPAVVFVVRTGEELRHLKALAPDVTAFVDVHTRIQEGGPSLSWAEVDRRLRHHQRESLASLDLSGLVPHTDEPVLLPLGKVYSQDAGLPGPTEGPQDKGGASGARVAVPVLAVAPPGGGKTTALKYLAWRNASGEATDWVQAERLAVFLPLALWSALARDQERTLLEFVAEQVAGATGGAPVDVDSHLGELALLLDGLDEVASVAARRALIDEVVGLARRGALVIVSAREHLVDSLLAEQLQRVRVVPLRQPDARAAVRFVERLVEVRRSAVPRPGLDPAEVLVERVCQHSEFLRFSANPLMLTFLVVLVELGRAIPDQRTELYRDLVEMLLTTWRRTRNRSASPMRRADLLKVLAPLGWHIVELGGGGVTEAELLHLLTGVEGRLEPDHQRAHDASRARLDQLRDDTAILRTQGGLWRFNHPTIAEYLAAQAAMQDSQRLATLAEGPYDPAWMQVVAFTLALATDIEPRDDVAARLLNALDKKASRRGVYDAKIPRTLVQVLVEARGMPATWRERLARHVVRVTFRQKLTHLRRREALNLLHELCAVADEPVRRALRSVTDDEAYDWGEVGAAQELDWWWWGSNEVRLAEALGCAGLDVGPLRERWLADERREVQSLAVRVEVLPADDDVLAALLSPPAPRRPSSRS